MSNYTKATNFASKDSLLTGNPLKIVKGTEIDNEFNAIATAVGTKFDTASLAAPGPIGATTPAAINGTTGTFSGDVQMASQNGGQLAGLRNRIINGDMRVSQRGASFTAGAVQYSLDRWQFYRSGAVAGATCIQTTAPSVVAIGFGNYAQLQRTNGNTSTAAIVLSTSFETGNIRDLAGQKVTLSFYCYCSGNAIGKTVGNIIYGTGADGSLGVGFTGSVIAGSVTSPSDLAWVKSSVTVTLPSNATQLGVSIAFSPTGTAGTTDYFGVVGVQLEIGAVATPFEQRPYGMELALCQRYYEETAFDIPVSGNTAVGMWAVEKRATPTLSTVYSVGSGGSVSTDPNAPRKAIRAGSYATVSASVKVIGVSEL